MELSSGAVRGACDIQVDGRLGARETQADMEETEGELATLGSAVGLATNCTTGPGQGNCSSVVMCQQIFPFNIQRLQQRCDKITCVIVPRQLCLCSHVPTNISL